MNLSLSRIPALIGPQRPAGRASAGHRLDPAHLGALSALAARLAPHRRLLLGYGQLLAGTGGRLCLQTVYFFLLANTLSLSDMGVFAAVSAVGVLIGCLAGFGFQSFVMRAAAGRRSSLGAYLGAYYACFALALPIMLGIAYLVHALLFGAMIPLHGYLAIIVVETVFWRQIELLIQVNSGLGRFGAASTLVSLPVAFRAAAVVAFWAAGGGGVETWSAYYLAGNAVAALVLVAVFHPRVRLRFSLALTLGRLRDGLMFALSYFLFLAQGEIDKLVVLTFAGERMAGIFAIAMRLVDLTGVPLRPIFMMYSRKLIQARRPTLELMRESLRIEGLVAAVSTMLLLALLAVLWLRPGILGPNVSTATDLLAAIIAVPAVRNLLEFHGELFFAFGRMSWRAGVTAALVVLKAVAIAALLTAVPRPEAWSLWLNAIFLGGYAISFLAVYRLMSRSTAS